MMTFPQIKSVLRAFGKRLLDRTLAVMVKLLIRLARLFDPDRLADFAGWFMRTLGPRLREHRIARDNLVAAFPDKSAAEIDAILMESWDNLGRVGAEFAHLDRLWQFDPDHPERGRVEVSPESDRRFVSMRDDGKPALIFAAHIGNWELPALAAPLYDFESTVLFRPPNIASFDRIVQDIRGTNMGEMVATSPSAPLRLIAALKRGSHVAMLVDQHFGRGVEVTFLGRRTRANPLLARLAQHVDCPIYGVRIIRLPNHCFRAELTEEIQPVRDASGAIDVVATTQVINDVVEGWIREYPGQWLWQHRRWK
ncbi:MAG: lipid A biosynthesis lauroyl acyltransferase [Xanthobacteraceae bacterium]|nr:MAG: lipid A biosynthesis lauroyl acyltransferase [Xanthobacteraceae bacterium]